MLRRRKKNSTSFSSNKDNNQNHLTNCNLHYPHASFITSLQQYTDKVQTKRAQRVAPKCYLYLLSETRLIFVLSDGTLSVTSVKDRQYIRANTEKNFFRIVWATSLFASADI